MSERYQSWADTLLDYFPESSKLRMDADKSRRWYSEINERLRSKPLRGRDELIDAIKWAGTHFRGDGFNPPSLSDVAGWVKRYRLDCEDKPEREPVVFEDMDAETQAYILSLYAQFKVNYTDVGNGYRELDGGETLDPTDEFNDDGEWKPMGEGAYERDGRPRRLVKYKATSVRRAVDSGIDEQT